MLLNCCFCFIVYITVVFIDVSIGGLVLAAVEYFVTIYSDIIVNVFVGTVVDCVVNPVSNLFFSLGYNHSLLNTSFLLFIIHLFSFINFLALSVIIISIHIYYCHYTQFTSLLFTILLLCFYLFSFPLRNITTLFSFIFMCCAFSYLFFFLDYIIIYPNWVVFHL